jgi:hypothetical protein
VFVGHCFLYSIDDDDIIVIIIHNNNIAVLLHSFIHGFIVL